MFPQAKDLPGEITVVAAEVAPRRKLGRPRNVPNPLEEDPDKDYKPPPEDECPNFRTLGFYQRLEQAADLIYQS